MLARFAKTLSDSAFKARVFAIEAVLRNLSDEQDRAGNSEPPGEVLWRLAAVMDWAHALIVGVDPRLLSQAMLDAADMPAQQIETALHAFVETSDASHLLSIDNACGELTGVLAGWPGSGPFSRPAIQRLASAFGTAADGRLASVRRDAEETARELASQLEALTGRLQEIQGGVADAQQSLTARQDDLDGQLQAARAQADTLVSSTETTLGEIQEAQRDRIDELVQAFEDRGARLETEQRERFDAIDQALGERAELLFASLETQRDEARNLLDVVATSATAGAFGKEADAQKREADEWRTNATKAAILAATIGVLSVLSGVFFDVSATLIVTKVTLTAVVAGIAGYAAGQSAHHRRREVRARRLYLELTAFGPFAEPLSDDDRATVRKDFIARLFVGDPQGSDGEVALTEESISLFGQVAKVLQRSG